MKVRLSLQSKVYIVGLGVEGRESLSKKAIELVHSASLVIGGERHLQEFPDFRGERFSLKANLKEMLGVVKNFTPPSPPLTKGGMGGVVVLASGDPGLYGIADYLIRNLGRDAVEIIPNVSAMQWAFAKAKVSWNDARIVSSHGRGKDKVLEAAREADKIGIFTSDGEEPSKIAKLLLGSGLSDFTAFVCEDLGMETEKVSELPLSDVVGKSFTALNVMVLVKQKAEVEKMRRWEDEKSQPLNLSTSQLPVVFGLPDSEFTHSKGLITKEEVRAVSLAKLRLRDDSVVWDIGAGSGSVGIEAARLCGNGKVFAIEKEPERVAHIRENIEKFGVNNLEVSECKAPQGIENFADPDALFIGGSGGNLSDILDIVKERLRPSGRVVINAITLETLHEATTGLKERGFEVDVVCLNISRSRDLIGMKMFEAENPVFIITGRKAS